MDSIKVSVVITTKNAQKYIENCLVSIKNQDYPEENIEIIVVDNFSKDKTKEIAKKYTDKVYDLGPERSAQRNFGIAQAHGQFILYLDVDMTLSKSLVSECVKKCENSAVGALYVPEKVIGSGFWCKVRNFERSFYNATVIDCVRFIKKEIYFLVKGFDCNFTGPEDWDFDKKIRKVTEVDLTENVIFHDEDGFSLRGYISKKGYYAKSFDGYIEKWGKDDTDIKKQLGFQYRFFGVFIENGKWKKLISHPVLTLAMYFLRFLVGVKFLTNKK